MNAGPSAECLYCGSPLPPGSAAFLCRNGRARADGTVVPEGEMFVYCSPRCASDHFREGVFTVGRLIQPTFDPPDSL